MYHKFKRLMNRMGKRPVVYQVHREDGYYDEHGHWVPGKVTRSRITPAAVLTLSEDDLAHDSGGAYSADDRKLICYQSLEPGTMVEANDTDYKVFGKRDYSDYAPELHSYILRVAGEASD